MGRTRKCCVGGCNTRSDTASLFNLPRNDQLRKLWMSFLVPTNSALLGLTKYELITKSVCEKHFERRNFDAFGRRHRLSYPSLITEAEVARGEPLPTTRDESNILEQHNYCKKDDDNNVGDPRGVILKSSGDFHEHLYSQAATAQTATDNTVTWLENVVELQSVQQSKVAEQDTLKQSVSKPISTYHNEVNKDTSNNIAPEHPSSKTSKKVLGLKKSSQKKCTRCTKLATESSGSQSVEEDQETMANQKYFKNFGALNKQVQSLLMMQLKNCRKNKMARRFTKEEKLMALTMRKQSPKEYQLLEKIFALPNKRTLSRLEKEPGLIAEQAERAELQTALEGLFTST